MSATLDLTRKLVGNAPLEDLSDEFAQVAEEIMSGTAGPVATAGFLTAMALRGETSAALAAFAGAMRKHAVQLFENVEESQIPPIRVDTCGTGGDHSNSFNISTASAFVVAGCGYPVVKHGNRGITSKSGSADVLEALGVEIETSPQDMVQRLAKTGLAFLFAPAYHPAMRHVGPIRRELGFRTLFNLVGPLANPAWATHQVVGVFSPSLVQTVAEALQKLGVRRALVVHGHGGMDEITLSGPSQAIRVWDDTLESLEIDPLSLGLSPADQRELTGGTAEDNAVLIESILANKANAAVTDVVLINAAAALSLVRNEKDLGPALAAARESLQSGRALEVLNAHRSAKLA
jgi:anthranilate phosphoribosyltransferase